MINNTNSGRPVAQLAAGDRVCWIQARSETGEVNVLREGTVHKVLGSFIEVATDGYLAHGFEQPAGIYGVTTGQIVLITPAPAGDR